MAQRGPAGTGDENRSKRTTGRRTAIADKRNPQLCLIDTRPTDERTNRTRVRGATSAVGIETVIEASPATVSREADSEEVSRMIAASAIRAAVHAAGYTDCTAGINTPDRETNTRDSPNRALEGDISRI